MDVAGFISKFIKDKDFMYEVFTHVPPEEVDQFKGNGQSQNDAGDGQSFKDVAHLCWYGAQAMGYGFTEEELTAEGDRQFGAMGGFAKFRFLLRMVKTYNKVAKR